MRKYIFVTGGVVSGLGKGIASASIGFLLKQLGYKISILKLDPYLNVDPGTMNPLQHGEVFVTDDGGETDLDLGHYERFININLSKKSSCSSGMIYTEIINKERKGDFLGKTIQVIPHITNGIKEKILSIGEMDDSDIIIVEIGGTVGDIESEPFLDAIRQLKNDLDKYDTLHLHLTLIPYLKTSKELKTKPTQHSVKELLRSGLQPDILLCRSEKHLSNELKEKISLFCNLDKKYVFEGIDVKSIYEVPINFKEIGIDKSITEILKLSYKDFNINNWEKTLSKYKKITESISIAIVGKYIELEDAYLSISEALKHAGIQNNVNIKIKWVNSEELEMQNLSETFKDIHGILIPGGFGKRGIEGKIKATQYARENKIPYFGICLGMQIAVIEFARNVCNIKEANSSEFLINSFSVIDIMDNQKDIIKKGGTMRLGAYPCTLLYNSKAYEAYGILNISERHRHRYEFNNKFRKILSENGLIISGTSPDKLLVEIIELPNHPWFIGVQFHPEFKSRLEYPHPLFVDFIKHASNLLKKNN